MTWESTQTRSPSGPFESLSALGLGPAVECSAAERNAWATLLTGSAEASTCGLVRSPPTATIWSCELLGVGPPLLRFGKPEFEVGAGSGERPLPDPRRPARAEAGRVDLVHAVRLAARRAQLRDRGLSATVRPGLRADPVAARSPWAGDISRVCGGRPSEKFAVFGATGTIGSALVPLLAEQHAVVAVSRRPRGNRTAFTGRSPTPRTRRGPHVLEGVKVDVLLGSFAGTPRLTEPTGWRPGGRPRRRARPSAPVVYLGGLGDQVARPFLAPP